MHEAPMPNISMLLAICAVSPAKYAFSIKYQIVRYRRPRPTTVIPITAPEENETRSAELRLFVAPVTVREFAAVAIFIPMKPASAENTPPTMNAIGTKKVMKPVAAKIARTMVTMTKKIATVLYWRFR